ncbi:MAG TPA: stage II sporulation protein M [Methanobacterium sp.]|nr:stage II sporulation protein M [Methanobacterium sp.]
MNKHILSLKMDKFRIASLIFIVITFLAAFTGFFEILFSPYQFTFTFGLDIDSINFPVSLTFYLNSAVLMFGMGIGIVSAFIENGKKFCFYGSILIILIGIGIIESFIGYMNPSQLIGQGLYNNNLESFFVNFGRLALHNIFYAFIAIISGPTIIGPYSLLPNIILDSSFQFTSFVATYGFKGVLLFFGRLHIYPEFFALIWAAVAGIKVALKSFESFINIRRNGFKSSLLNIKGAMMQELKSTMPKVVVLLIIAAFLETLWTPFWINYWLQHIL